MFTRCLAVLTIIVSTGFAESGYLGAPFPLSIMDQRAVTEGGLFYSRLDAEDADLDSYGFSALYSWSGSESAMTRVHAGLFGDIQNGSLKNLYRDMDMKGFSTGGSITPSFKIPCALQGFRPSVFFGANAIYQNLDVDKWAYLDNAFEHSIIAYGYGNITYGDTLYLQYPISRQVFQMGLYTGIHLEFGGDTFSLAPFFMTQASRGMVKWTVEDDKIHDSSSFAVHTAGCEFRLRNPNLSVVVMAQFIGGGHEKDARLYTASASMGF